MIDLPVTAAILFEHTAKELQFPWETSLVTHGSGSVIVRRLQHRMLIGRVVV